MRLSREPIYHHINDLNVVIRPDGNKGVGDSLGRTSIAALIYDEDRPALIDGLRSYFVMATTSPEAGSQMYVLRYPYGTENAVRGNSRDHVVIFLSCMKQMCNYFTIDLFLTLKAKRPCIDHPYTFGQKIWFKALLSKSWSFVYLAYKLPGLAVIYPAWNFFLRLISGTLKTYDSPAMMQLFDPPTKWQKFCYKLQLPTYASFYTLFQINALESKFAKRVLQFVMRLHFEKSNYVARAMCGQYVEYPKGYVPSRKNRWSIRLDRTCNRDMTPYNDTEETNIEMGMLKYFCK